MFSGTVLVAKRGRPVYQKAYGQASKTFGVPNGIDTKFNLGSINKIFTKTAICQLVDKGKLSFDDTLGKWLPDYPNVEARKTVTIRHLLLMTSGIGDFFGERFDSTPKDKIRGISDYLPLFADQSLGFRPGESRAYSNGGYVVLGAIIEKVSGQSYYNYVRDQIYKPAGMKNTDSYEADVPTPDLAEGYTNQSTGARTAGSKRVSNIYIRPGRGSSAGGGYSTAPDLLRFTEALQNYTLLSPAASSCFFSDDMTGKPLQTEQKEQGKIAMGGLGIAGGAPGINAALEADFEKEFTIVVLSNYDPPAAESVARYIRRLMANVKD
jgi:CubicO group peptidase (beta-lactamase class C family)